MSAVAPILARDFARQEVLSVRAKCATVIAASINAAEKMEMSARPAAMPIGNAGEYCGGDPSAGGVYRRRPCGL